MVKKNLFSAFNNSPYFSTKHNNYFYIYDQLFAQYQEKEITFVEVGVLSGGSLFMWRDFLGHKARIIGIDLNPGSMKWSDDFEIFIGDQADPNFWNSFYNKVGKIDVLLDDGGHRNRQQIQTVVSSLEWINNGGMIVTEDTHTSFMSLFGNPSKYSFINFATNKGEALTKRHTLIGKIDQLVSRVYSIRFFDSIVAFEINDKFSAPGSGITNSGARIQSVDFKNNSLSVVSRFIRYCRIAGAKKFFYLKKFKFLKLTLNTVFSLYFKFESKIVDRNLRQYF